MTISLTKPEMWVKRNIIDRKPSKWGSIVHRKLGSLPKYLSLDVLQDVLRRYGYLFVISNGYIIVFCHTGPVSIYR